MKVMKTDMLDTPRTPVTFLYLDSDIPSGKWRGIMVDGFFHEVLYMSGDRFDVVPIEGRHNFTGKTVEFVVLEQ